MLSSLAALRYSKLTGPWLSSPPEQVYHLFRARLRTPAVKLAQVADMEFFRTYGLLWSRERAPNSGDPLPLFG